MIQRLTTAQSLIRILETQYAERDGREFPFFAGVWDIFGRAKPTWLPSSF